VIYVVRDPKDVAVSYYHLNRLFRTQGYVGDFERYWRYFQQGLSKCCFAMSSIPSIIIIFSDPWLPYYSHVKEARQHAHLSNVLFLRYEDMLVDLPGAVNSIANFLECPVKPEDLDRLLDHLSIKSFRENKSVNMHEMASVGILNKGEAGFVRSGAKTAHQPQQEFVENPKLLNSANEWVEHNVKCLKAI